MGVGETVGGPGRSGQGEERGAHEGRCLFPFFLPQTCFSPGSDGEAGLAPGPSARGDAVSVPGTMTS